MLRGRSRSDTVSCMTCIRVSLGMDSILNEGEGELLMVRLGTSLAEGADNRIAGVAGWCKNTERWNGPSASIIAFILRHRIRIYGENTCPSV